jgi:phosphotransferase system enzyme I (PtsI)
LLDNVDIFKVQVRAVLRASFHKNIKLMLPMVASIDEIRRTKEIIYECKAELKKEKAKFDNHMNLGVMVEIPSAAVMAKEFGEEVDFLSIGTNDLIQFLLAVDRANEIISSQYEEFHPAVIRTLNNIIKHGKMGKALVSMCGEMAADTVAVPLLVGMGLDAISASPSSIPYIKKVIRNLDYKKAQELAEDCLKFTTAKEISDRIEKFFSDNLIQETKSLI